MNFTPFKAISNIAFLDDDNFFLESLPLAVPKDFRFRLFDDPRDLDRHLSRQASLLRKEQHLLNQICSPHSEMPTIQAALQYFSWAERMEIVSVLVSDHVMPTELGTSVCARHEYHGMRRILLTGAGDADLAVTAFNDGIIETFIPKQSTQLFSKLKTVLQHQNDRSMELRGHHLQHCMTARQINLLASPSAKEALDKYMAELGVIEFVWLPEPLGVLGRKSENNFVWIQVEDGDSMRELAQSLDEEEWTPEEIASVQSGRMLPNLELTACLDEIPHAFSVLRALCEETDTRAAHFEFTWPTRKNQGEHCVP